MITGFEIRNIVGTILDDDVYTKNTVNTDSQIINYIIGRVNHLTHNEADPLLILHIVKDAVTNGNDKVAKT